MTAHALAQQAEQGRLKARKVGPAWVTTARWLEEYLATYSRRGRGGVRSEPFSTFEPSLV